MNRKNKVVLVICDGMGYSPKGEFNAIRDAKTPNLDKFYKEYPHILLQAGGEAIGLPMGQMGTSEANHLILGSGRVIYQNLLKINRSIKEGGFQKDESLLKAIGHAKTNGSNLHIIGLLGPGGVHAHTNHLKAIAQTAKKNGVDKIVFHLFTDGRDTLPKSALGFMNEFMEFVDDHELGVIATVGGRYWGMDRDNNYDRIEKAFAAMRYGKGVMYEDPLKAITDSYDNGITDEFITPVTIGTDESPTVMNDNDAVIFANFRADRANELTRRILKENIPNLCFVAMTKYADDIDVPVIFPPEIIENTLSEIISAKGIKQLRITETEKFTHLTFFFNAQRNQPDAGEERIMIPSNKDVATHDKKPEMKALQIAEGIKQAIEKDEVGFIATNIVNCDIVGHTGVYDAIITAVETVDEALGIIVDTAKENGWDVLITADHGNAEEKFDEFTNQVTTSHTTNPVPFILISEEADKINKEEGTLTDVAPTILKLMDIDIPKEMTGDVLI